jgi:hypothetical protein
MAEPLLSSLCRICHTNPPKYRCPRCSSQTCSLACSKRHKLWSECNGVRDPTVYKPRHELATPAGIDHDYNFISSIERGIERTDKLIVEEKGLVDRKELLGGEHNRRWNTRQRTEGVSTLLSKALEQAGVVVDRAPKGMKRSKDNSTNLSKHVKCINWQVEWIRDDGSRILGKVLENHLLGEAYAALLEEQRRANMTEAEKKHDKKRKADEIKRHAKKAKTSSHFDLLVQTSTLQNPESSAWDQVVMPESEEVEPDSSLGTCDESPGPPSKSYQACSGFYFYLHRPYTPSSHPRVLIPLQPSESLSKLLRNRVVLEFPTIYAISSPPTCLPDTFMLEDDYFKRHFDTPQRNTDKHFDMEEGEVV